MTQFKYINASLLILIAGLVFNAPRSLGYTNPIEGGSTETVTNTWTVPGGELYVGQTTPNNTLTLSNGEVYNTRGFIGSHAGSDSNSVSVLYRNRAGGSSWHVWNRRARSHHGNCSKKPDQRVWSDRTKHGSRLTHVSSRSSRPRSRKT